MATATVPAPFLPCGEHLTIALPGGRALFTTRRGGASELPYDSLNLAAHVGDDPATVARNLATLGELAGIAPERLAQGRPVHGTDVRRVRRIEDLGASPPPCDGAATSLRGVAPLALGADCLPIALVAPGAVAMVHAGWRGLAAGILAEAARAVAELAPGRPVSAAIGPGAGPCCYEVGDEVHAAFARHGDAACDGDRIDLKLIVRRELEAAGVGAVHDVGLCTICDAERFFSHRRDGVTGRQGGIAWRS